MPCPQVAANMLLIPETTLMVCRTGRFCWGRSRRIAWTLCSLVWLAPSSRRLRRHGRKRSKPQLLQHAPKILQRLQERDCHSVGVLKFLVLRGHGTLDHSAGTLNLLLAHRLEAALVLCNPPQPSRQIDLVRNASSLAAGIAGASHLEAFHVASPAKSREWEMYYGADVGTMSLVVFQESGERPQASVSDEAVDLAAISRAAFPQEPPRNASALCDLAPAAKSRILVASSRPARPACTRSRRYVFTGTASRCSRPSSATTSRAATRSRAAKGPVSGSASGRPLLRRVSGPCPPPQPLADRATRTAAAPGPPGHPPW